MRAVRVLLLCGLGMLAAAGCDSSGTPPPAVRTVTVTPSSPAQPGAALSSAPPSSAATRVFDSRAMASAVIRLLTTDYKVAKVGKVSCPDRQPVADGSRFQCTVDVAGTTKHVPITVTGEDGDYKVGPPE